MGIERIVKKTYEQLYAQKFGDLDEIDQFFERYSMPKLTQEETDNMNRHISIY